MSQSLCSRSALTTRRAGKPALYASGSTARVSSQAPKLLRILPVAPSLGQRTGLYAQRGGPVEGVVVHTTGRALLRRLTAPKFAEWRKKNPKAAKDAFSAAIWMYQNMKAAPHYVVCGETGRVAQMTQDNLVAWHVGRRSFGKSRVPAWWRNRWTSIRHPRDLPVVDRSGSTNPYTIGIEVTPPQDPSAPWSEEAWTSLRLLVHSLSLKHGFRPSPTTVVTHSDCNPWARTDQQGRPWDPPPHLWPP